MNVYLKQLMINAIIIPIAYVALKLIFKKSIMFLYSFYTVFYVIFVAFMTVVGQNLGGLHSLWITPLNVIGGVILFSYINRVMRKPLSNTIEKLNALAEGDLEIDVQRSLASHEIGVLSNALLDLSARLKEVVSGIKNSALSLTSASTELSQSSQQLSQNASEQAGSIEEVSSTMEEMTANIQQNTDNANQTATVSLEAFDGITEVADRSQEAVEANKAIAEKITVINDIALQTNILALNAAVEAARAGVHGKGFAVVAAEVRKLAENSKVAAEEIVHLAQSSLMLSTTAGEVMGRTMPKIENTSQLVEEIAAASTEQTNGANQVNQAILQLTGITQQNATASEELSANSNALAQQARDLNDAISFFKMKENKVSFTPKQASKPLSKPSPKVQPVQKKQTVSLNEYTKPETQKNTTSGLKLNMFSDDSLDSGFENF